MKVSSDRDFPAHLYIFIFVYFEYSEFFNNILHRTLTSWAQHDKTQRKIITFKDKGKSISYSDLEGNLKKINSKPLFSCNKEIYVAKEFKENALASGAKHEVWCRKPLTNPLI